MTHDEVRAWLAGYERAWRSPGTDGLAGLFTDDATYSPSPWREPVRGLAALASWWEGERDGPDEEFTAGYRVLAVDGAVAVVRAEVDYASTEGNHGRWRDLWVLEFADDGRVRSFEEWPFAPDQRDGHED